MSVLLLGAVALLYTAWPPTELAGRATVVSLGSLLVFAEVSAISRDRRQHRTEMARIFDRFAELAPATAELVADRMADALLKSQGVPAEDPRRVEMAESAKRSAATIEKIGAELHGYAAIPFSMRSSATLGFAQVAPDGTWQASEEIPKGSFAETADKNDPY